MLSINFSELIWTIVNFFLLLFLLRHFLYQPICRHLDDRQARIDAGLEQERAARAALEAEDARLETEKQKAREQARALLQQEDARAAEESGEALRRAKRDAREAGQTRRQQMQADSRREGDRLSAEEPALAAELARLLLGEEGDGR